MNRSLRLVLVLLTTVILHGCKIQLPCPQEDGPPVTENFVMEQKAPTEGGFSYISSTGDEVNLEFKSEDKTYPTYYEETTSECASSKKVVSETIKTTYEGASGDLFIMVFYATAVPKEKGSIRINNSEAQVDFSMLNDEANYKDSVYLSNGKGYAGIMVQMPNSTWVIYNKNFGALEISTGGKGFKKKP